MTTKKLLLNGPTLGRVNYLLESFTDDQLGNWYLISHIVNESAVWNKRGSLLVGTIKPSGELELIGKQDVIDQLSYHFVKTGDIKLDLNDKKVKGDGVDNKSLYPEATNVRREIQDIEGQESSENFIVEVRYDDLVDWLVFHGAGSTLPKVTMQPKDGYTGWRKYRLSNMEPILVYNLSGETHQPRAFQQKLSIEMFTSYGNEWELDVREETPILFYLLPLGDMTEVMASCSPPPWFPDTSEWLNASFQTLIKKLQAYWSIRDLPKRIERKQLDSQLGIRNPDRISISPREGANRQMVIRLYEHEREILRRLARQYNSPVTKVVAALLVEAMNRHELL